MHLDRLCDVCNLVKSDKESRECSQCNILQPIVKLEEGEGPHLQIETLPNTPSPSLSPPPVERVSEDSLEDRDSSGLQTCSSPPQSLPAIREANRQSYKQKLNSLNSHLEMVDFSGGDVVSDKVQCFIYCSTTCHAHNRKVLIRKVS